MSKPSFPHRLLWCRLESIEFPDSITCQLNLPSGNCTDMAGAIKVAESVTRHLDGFTLLRVHTVASGDWPRETIYFRETVKSTWHARSS